MPNYIHFYSGLSAEYEDHYAYKGYRDDVVVEIEGLFYEVYFYLYDWPGHFQYYAFPGMIILEEISTENICNAVRELMKLNYFDYFKGATSIDIDNRFIDRWYIQIGPSDRDAPNREKLEI